MQTTYSIQCHSLISDTSMAQYAIVLKQGQPSHGVYNTMEGWKTFVTLPKVT